MCTQHISQVLHEGACVIERIRVCCHEQDEMQSKRISCAESKHLNEELRSIFLTYFSYFRYYSMDAFYPLRLNEALSLSPQHCNIFSLFMKMSRVIYVFIF